MNTIYHFKNIVMTYVIVS